MKIYIDYFKACQFIVDRQKYIEKYTTHTYNAFGEIATTKYNAPDFLINIEGTYVESKNLLNSVSYHNRMIVNQFLTELKNPNNDKSYYLEFKWKRS